MTLFFRHLMDRPHAPIQKYVISVPGSSRRATFFRQDGGEAFKVFDAVAPAAGDPAPEWQEQRFQARYGRPALPGEIGCAVSHARLHEHIGREFARWPNEYALIVEDDCTLPIDFGSRLTRVLRMDRRSDFILLGLVWERIDASSTCSTLEAVPISALSAVRLRISRPYITRVGLMRPNNFAGTLAYLIKVGACQKATRLNKDGISWVADDWHLAYERGFRVSLVRPNMVEEATAVRSEIRSSENRLRISPVEMRATDHGTSAIGVVRSKMGVTVRDGRDRLWRRTLDLRESRGAAATLDHLTRGKRQT